MYKKACPACGSRFFLSSRRRSTTVFQVIFDGSIERITDDSGAAIDQEAIFCGACSWHGDMNQLLESR